MRKLFFIVFCILAFDICLAEGKKWWEENFIIGAHWGPPLQYNENGQLTRDFNLLKDGGFNFTLGKFSPHNNQTESFLAEHLDSLIEECKANEIFFLNDTADYDTTDTVVDTIIVNGVNIKDEPKPEDSTRWLNYVRRVKNDSADWLGFLNFYPSHAEIFNKNFNNWKEYIDAYLGDTTLLQVACFENYSPHCHFPTSRPKQRANYYANLAYMKQAAGSRPLWAYLKCAGKDVEERDSAWQDAYMRIGAFAPLAFGAKGIVFFCYDCQDRNRIRRAPEKTTWEGHDMYFDNDEASRQIFFGNFKNNPNGVPDLAVHTNDSLGTWYIKESLDNWTESDSNPMIKIGTWFGDHINHIPNIYNWDFNPNGRDKFTTITRDGRLLLSRFRSGWTHRAIIDVPWSLWSSMSRHTCPFGDFNDNQKLDLCLGWTENGQGKLRIYMDCQKNAVQDPSTTITDMSFTNTSQIFTFSDSIKQVFTRNDSIWVITSNRPDTIDNQYKLTDGVYLLKYGTNQFDSVYVGRIILNVNTNFEHYWMEDSLYMQDIDGNIWKAANGQAYDLRNRMNHFGARENYVWGQYNTWTQKYDRYRIAPEERYGYQTYALLDRKGRPNRIYYTAKTINQFINDSISPIIKNGKWLGAYFTTTPFQTNLDSLKIIKKEHRGQDVPNPLPLISDGFLISDCMLLGLFIDKNDNLDLLVINLKQAPQNLVFTIDQYAPLPLSQLQMGQYTYSCDKITRMYSSNDSHNDVYQHYTTIELNNMLGGECAVVHLKYNPN